LEEGWGCDLVSQIYYSVESFLGNGKWDVILGKLERGRKCGEEEKKNRVAVLTEKKLEKKL
jgi:hypothetical protein